MSRTTSGDVLAARTLNRTTLARQLLLERADLDPVAAVSRLGGLQAQEPASPYVALWSRLRDFTTADLDRAFAERQVVKATLMRQTLHAVAAADYPATWAAHSPLARRGRMLRMRWAELGMTDDRVEELVEAALAYATEPRTNQELIDFLNARAPALAEREWWWGIRTFAPLLYEPGAAPWSFGRRPTHRAARAVLDLPTVEPDDGLDHVVRRYLAAFGPATVGDIAQFTRLGRAGIRTSVRRIDGELVRHRDDCDRELLDLVDATAAEPDTPAPVRLLPMWDSALLAYEDRSRLIPDALRKVVIRVNGDLLPTVLVDGAVAGVWRVVPDGTGVRVVWCTFAKVAKRVQRDIEGEAGQLAAFLGPRVPTSFARSAAWWSDPAIAQAFRP